MRFSVGVGLKTGLLTVTQANLFTIKQGKGKQETARLYIW